MCTHTTPDTSLPRHEVDRMSGCKLIDCGKTGHLIDSRSQKKWSQPMAFEVRVVKGAEKHVAEALGPFASGQQPEVRHQGEVVFLTFTNINDVPEFVRIANETSGVSTFARKTRRERKI